MTHPRDTGFGIIWTKENSSYRIPPEDFPRALADWMAGKTFYEGHTFHGGELIIKLGVVESIQLTTPESYKAFEEEQKQDKTAKLFNDET